MNAAVNVTLSTAVPQASSTVPNSPVNVTSLDGEVQALLNGLRPTVIVSPQSATSDAVNVIPNTDAVQAFNTVQGSEIDGLVLTLLGAEVDDLKKQIDVQCNIIMLAAVEKYRLEKLLEAKEREIENYKPFVMGSIEPAEPEPIKPEPAKGIEVVTIIDDDDDAMVSLPATKCGYFFCGEPVVEGSDYCTDPDHDYDGFAQRIPDFDCDLFPADDTTLPSIDFPSLTIASSSQDSSSISSLADDVFATSTPATEITSTPEDQYIAPSKVPPSIRKRGYVFKCYEGGCHKPESFEGGFFCEEHTPENQMGYPQIYNEYHGITTPIKRHKMFIPLMKTRRRKRPTSKPTLKKYQSILPKM